MILFFPSVAHKKTIYNKPESLIILKLDEGGPTAQKSFSWYIL